MSLGSTSIDIPGTLSLPPWRLSVEKYHEMIQSGIIGPDDRIELLEGMLVAKTTISPSHRYVKRALYEALRGQIPHGWYVDSQAPITLTSSEPEPDAIVVRGNSEDYTDRHPGPSDCALVAEVADSSMAKDRITKKAIYAAAGIAVYWIVNLVDRRLEVYSGCITSASGAEYATMQFYGPTDNVPLVIDGQPIAEIAVGSLLP